MLDDECWLDCGGMTWDKVVVIGDALSFALPSYSLRNYRLGNFTKYI